MYVENRKCALYMGIQNLELVAPITVKKVFFKVMHKTCMWLKLKSRKRKYTQYNFTREIKNTELAAIHLSRSIFKLSQKSFLWLKLKSW